MDHFDGGEEDLWRAVDALRAAVRLTWRQTPPGLWRLAEEGDM
jgi:hypothetical protein